MNDQPEKVNPSILNQHVDFIKARIRSALHAANIDPAKIDQIMSSVPRYFRGYVQKIDTAADRNVVRCYGYIEGAYGPDWIDFHFPPNNKSLLDEFKRAQDTAMIMDGYFWGDRSNQPVLEIVGVLTEVVKQLAAPVV
jgi:hypothetical protein